MTMLLPAAHLHVGASGVASFVFSAAVGSYLQATVDSSAPDRRTATISLWIKTNTLASGFYGVFGVRQDNANGFEIFQDGGDDSINIVSADSGSASIVEYAAGSVDVSGEWNHFVFRVDTTQATEADRVRLYKNGSALTTDEPVIPSQNYDHSIFSNGRTMFIGKDAETATGARFNGKVAFLDVVENASLDPTDFAFDNSGVWTRIPYAGSYGTHGFSVDGSSAFNTTAGKAYSFTTPGSVTLDFTDLPPYTS